MNKTYHWLAQNISPGGKPDLSQSTTFSQNIQIYLKYTISIQSALLGGIIRSPRGTHSPTCYFGIFQNIQNISAVYTKYWLQQCNRRHHWFAKRHPISVSQRRFSKGYSKTIQNISSVWLNDHLRALNQKIPNIKNLVIDAAGSWQRERGNNRYCLLGRKKGTCGTHNYQQLGFDIFQGRYTNLKWSVGRIVWKSANSKYLQNMRPSTTAI